MLKKSIIGLLGLLLVGCASSPNEMAPTYVSPLQYQDYTCKQIGAESAMIERRVSELYGSLDKKASNDSAQMAAGLIIFWPALFFLEGGDGPEAVEYRRMRGEYDALQKVAIQKNCGLTFNIQKALPEKPKKDNRTEADKRISGK